MVFRSLSWDAGALEGRRAEEISDPTVIGVSFSSESMFCCSVPETTAGANSCSLYRAPSVSMCTALTTPGSTSLSSEFTRSWSGCTFSNYGNSSNCDTSSNTKTTASYSYSINGSTADRGCANSSSASSCSKEESKGRVAVLRLAFFCLGVSCGLPWNCVVVEMTEFQRFYLPTFPWVSTATEVRACCSLLGHLLLCLLSLRHSAVWLSAGGSVLSATCCLLLSFAAPSAVPAEGMGNLQEPLGTPSSPSSEGMAFACSCILLGISSFCCCGIRSGLYIQQALTHKSFISSWVVGLAIGGPLTALFALGLHWCTQALPPQCRTQILMGASAVWLLFSAAVFAYALAKPNSSGKQMPPQQQSKEQHQQQQLPVATAAAPGAAKQQEGPQNCQLPEDGCGEGAKGLNNSSSTGETTALLSDFRSHGKNSSSSRWKIPEFAAGAPDVRSAILQRFGVYAVLFRRYRRSLLCTFFLSFSTFIVYPVKMQCMFPCSKTDPAFFQLLLIVIYHLGVVAGRCCYCCFCSASSSHRVIPAVLLLRLAVLPLLFWLEAAPAKLLPVLRAAIAATATPGITGLRGAAGVARVESPLQHEHVATAATLAVGEQKYHEELLLMLVDVCRCHLLLIFAAVHGCLSLAGTLYTTRTPETYTHKAAAARLLCLFESSGLALGTALSLAISRPIAPLYGWQHTAATTLSHLT